MPENRPQEAWRTVISAVCVLAGIVMLVPAVFYSYLNINPPVAGEGDLYFGDGTGFVIGGMFGIPGLLALAVGLALVIRARRLRG